MRHTKYVIIMLLAIASLAASVYFGSISGCSSSGSAGTAPTVIATSPIDAATGVALNRKIAADFNTAMNPTTITTSSFTLMQGATAVAGTVAYSGISAVFTPTSNLLPSTVYTATIKTTARSVGGLALATNKVWTFTTGTTTDTTLPTVTSTNPVNAATGVALNMTIAASFSKEMDPLTLTTSTVVVTGPGTTSVTGTVGYVLGGSVEIFVPTSNLTASTLYTVTITGAKDLSDNALATYSWTFTTGTAADTTAPTVSFVTPLNAATDVPLNQKIAVTFDEGMNPLTITTTTFTVTGPDTTPVTGTFAYALGGNIATFTPDSNLTASTLYTVTVTTGVTDLTNNALASNYSWTFTTGTTVDTTAPTVASTNPADLDVDVSLNQKIAATFSKTMDPTTITNLTFTLSQGATSVPGTVTYVGLTATFNPTSNLTASTVYTATITTEVKDLVGNAMAAASTWTFTTGTTADTTAPTVLSTVPADGDVGVFINRDIVATFSKAVDPATITTGTFTLAQGATPVVGVVTSLGSVATFNPTGNLAASTTYTATITTGAKDLAGNALAANMVWTFTTAAGSAAGPAPVNLGTAGNYVILAKSAVSTVPASVITGDVGVSPAATSFLTGFSLTMVGTTSATSAQVTGSLYGADMTAPTSTNLTTAVLDMETAYTDAAGRALPDFTELGAGNITGMTLVPGLYKWGTGVAISAAGVTLNGGPDDVWIFQIGQGLTVEDGAIITLAGGALPQNIFWQVAGQAILKTTSQFKGNILCQTQINLQTGAIMNGRALAQTQVTLDTTTIKPTL